MRKISQPGVALCLCCKETLHYGSSGKKRIKLYAAQNKAKNLNNQEIFLKNTTIPASWIYPNKVAKPSDVCSQSCDLLYGVTMSVHDPKACSSKRTS